MFSKDDKSTKEAETIIGQSVKVKGDFNGEGNVLIDGEFEGTLKTLGNLSFGAKSNIIAEVYGNNAKILGTVHGNIFLTGSLELGKNSVILGNIQATALSVEQGSTISGQVIINSSSTQNSTLETA